MTTRGDAPRHDGGRHKDDEGGYKDMALGQSHDRGVKRKDRQRDDAGGRKDREIHERKRHEGMGQRRRKTWSGVHIQTDIRGSKPWECGDKAAERHEGMGTKLQETRKGAANTWAGQRWRNTRGKGKKHRHEGVGEKEEKSISNTKCELVGKSNSSKLKKSVMRKKNRKSKINVWKIRN